MRLIMKNYFRFQGPAWFWAILIFIGSSLPGLTAPDLGFQWEDKLAHLIEFAVFGFVLMRAFSNSKNLFFRRHAWLLALLVGIIYGALDELHQRLVPGRSADLADWIADALGIATGQLIYFLVYHFQLFKTRQVKYE